MGTRAMISFDGKPVIATHWDGYPDGMGQELLDCRNVADILAVAEKHVIDAIDHEIYEEHSELWSIKDYGDLAEYQYDVRMGKNGIDKIYVSPLSGEWNPKAQRRYTPLEKGQEI